LNHNLRRCCTQSSFHIGQAAAAAAAVRTMGIAAAVVAVPQQQLLHYLVLNDFAAAVARELLCIAQITLGSL